MKRKIAARLSLALLLALTSSLVGCFDYELFLDLKADGSSRLRETLTTPKVMDEAPIPSMLDNIKRPIPTRQRLVEGDNVVLVEKVKISRLDRLSARRVQYAVIRKEGSLLEIGASLHQVVITLLPTDDAPAIRDEFPDKPLDPPPPPEPPSEPNQAIANNLWRKSLDGHFVNIRLRLPGAITEARGVNIGATRVDPTINQARDEVNWALPVWALVADNTRETIVLTVDFDGRFAYSTQVLRGYRGKNMVVQSQLFRPGQPEPEEDFGRPKRSKKSDDESNDTGDAGDAESLEGDADEGEEANQPSQPAWPAPEPRP